MATFGQRLKGLRNSRGISQNELSKHIGVSKSSVNMYERDEREPSFETLEAIADYFNVTMDYLLGREPKEPFMSGLPEIDSIVNNFDPAQFSTSARPAMRKLFTAMADFDSPASKEDFEQMWEEVSRNCTLSDVKYLIAITKAFADACEKEWQSIATSQELLEDE